MALPEKNIILTELIRAVSALTNQIADTVNQNEFDSISELLVKRQQMISKLIASSKEKNDLLSVRNFIAEIQERDQHILQYMKCHYESMKSSISKVSKIKNYLS